MIAYVILYTLLHNAASLTKTHLFSINYNCTKNKQYKKILPFQHFFNGTIGWNWAAFKRNLKHPRTLNAVQPLNWFLLFLFQNVHYEVIVYPSYHNFEIRPKSSVLINEHLKLMAKLGGFVQIGGWFTLFKINSNAGCDFGIKYKFVANLKKINPVVYALFFYLQ